MQALAAAYPSLAHINVTSGDWMVGTDILASKSKTTLQLNPSVWNPARLAAHADEWTGLMVEPSVPGIVVHEMGHILDGQARDVLGIDAYTELVHRYNPDAYTAREAISLEIAPSIYGQEESGEYMAEAFAAHWFDKAADGYPLQWGGLRTSHALWDELDEILGRR